MQSTRKTPGENKRPRKATLSKPKPEAGTNGTARKVKPAKSAAIAAADLTGQTPEVNPQWPDVVVDPVVAPGPPSPPAAAIQTPPPVALAEVVAAEVQTAKPPLVRLMTADKLLKTETEYLWRPYLPASGIVLLTGDVESGKSTLLTAIIAQMTGGPMLEGKRDRAPGNALVYGSEEDLSSTYKPRLEAAGANLSRVIFGDLAQDGKRVERLRLPDDIRQLRSRVTDSGISVVVLDPLTGYLGDGLDERSNRQVRDLLTALAALGHELGCLILYTVHPRKSTAGGMLTRISGVKAWGEVPRIVIHVGKNPDRPEQRVLTFLKNSLGPDKPSRLFSIVDFEGAGRFVLGRPTSMTAEDVGGDGEAPAERDAMGDAVAFLKDLLQDEDVATVKVRSEAEKANVVPRTLSRAKHKLGVTSVKIGSGPMGFWAYRKPAAYPE